MAVPKFYELMPAIINCLGDGKIHTLKELTAYCADLFKLSDDDKAEVISSGQNRLHNRVGWAKTYMMKAGLIESPQRAHFKLAELGEKAFKQGSECVTLEYLNQFESFKDFQGHSLHGDENEQQISSNSESPQERIESALKELNDELVEDLMSEIMKISPYDFERLVVKLLIAMGYGTMEENKDAVTPKSGDEGIDGIVSADKFGFDCIYIQAKQWKKDNLVSRPEIQKFIGALATTQGATKGIFITTSDFTKGAAEIVAKQTQNKIVLINGKQLAKLMIEYNLGVSTLATYRVKRIDSDFFNEDI